MISHDLKCIFIHVPKCAGSSFESVLGHYDMYTGRGKQDHRSLRAIQKPVNILSILSSREHAIEYVRARRNERIKNPNPKNRLTVTPRQLEEYFKFAIVRNPWSRALSWYLNVINDEYHIEKFGYTDKVDSFEDFVNRFVGSGMLRPQSYYIKNFSTAIEMDYIGKYEQLDDCFEHVNKQLGHSLKPLPHLNPGKIKDYREYYTDSVAETVFDAYREDVNLFGYAF